MKIDTERGGQMHTYKNETFTRSSQFQFTISLIKLTFFLTSSSVYEGCPKSFKTWAISSIIFFADERFYIHHVQETFLYIVSKFQLDMIIIHFVVTKIKTI